MVARDIDTTPLRRLGGEGNYVFSGDLGAIERRFVKGVVGVVLDVDPRTHHTEVHRLAWSESCAARNRLDQAPDALLEETVETAPILRKLGRAATVPALMQVNPEHLGLIGGVGVLYQNGAYHPFDFCLTDWVTHLARLARETAIDGQRNRPTYLPRQEAVALQWAIELNDEDETRRVCHALARHVVGNLLTVADLVPNAVVLPFRQVEPVSTGRRSVAA